MRAGSLLMTMAVLACAPTPVAQRQPAPVQGYQLIATYPHDPAAFTQGLVFADGQLYESTGLNGESSVRRVEIASGKVLQQIQVPEDYFAEGLALVGEELLQLTWQHQRGFVYDRKTFAQKRTFAYQGEGWGIAYDAAGGLVMSNGSDTLTFLDARTQAVARTIRVRDAGRAVSNLNELEWVDGEIWANVWTTDRVARISPTTGDVTAWVDLSALWPRGQRQPPADVMNGIAYDQAARRIFVTGKKWPRVYQIAVP